MDALDLMSEGQQYQGSVREEGKVKTEEGRREGREPREEQDETDSKKRKGQGMRQR